MDAKLEEAEPSRASRQGILLPASSTHRILMYTDGRRTTLKKYQGIMERMEEEPRSKSTKVSWKE